MKRIITICLIALTLTSFTMLVAGSYSINGTINGVANGTMVRIERQDAGKRFIVVDSAKVQNGKFLFKGTVSEPEIHFIHVSTKKDEKVAFILEEGNITLSIYKDSIAASRIGGTSNNEDLQRFNAAAMALQKKMSDFQTVNTKKMTDAQAAKDTETINRLMGEFNGFQNELVQLASAFPEKNPKSFISVLFVDNMFNNPEIDINRIRAAYENLDPKIKATKPGLAVKSKIENFKDIGIGSTAPEFSAPSPDGTPVSLKQSLGKITIIDFWASWCGPCRKENPNVVALYNEFHPKGLNIIGVSLDKDATKWKDAIAKDGLTWTHLSNLMFWSDPIAEMYNVKSIPATFIVDKDGKIIAKDLRGDALHAKIRSLLE